MREPDWLRLFPDSDFRWSMNLRPGDARDFFSPAEVRVDALEERGRLLESHPNEYALLPIGEADLIDEAINRLVVWSGLPFQDGLDAGKRLASDWVLLRPGEGGVHRVAAGVVCFPSGWSLPEKAGLPLAEVHGSVPRLNEVLGRQIDTFLAKLAPGAEWERENWGLSADAELDHHPRHRRPMLHGGETLSAVWIRLERQLLVRLSGGGILFAIHVSNHHLDEVVASVDGLSDRITRSLRTMPEESARYKGIEGARLALADRLATHDP
jgi:hypothetical protein